MKKKYICYFIIVMSVFILPGCGNRSPIVPVSGVVTLDGKPLEGFKVFFQPVNIDPSRPALTASAITDSQGYFQLKTIEDYPRVGVSVGEYRVRISWFDPNGHTVGETEPERKPPIQIPLKYQIDGITFNVPEKGTKTAKFQLTDIE